MVSVAYEELSVIMCNYCIVAGSLKAEEVIMASGIWDYNLIFVVGDESVLVKEHLDGPVEFASAGLEGMEYFEDLKELIFESTQSIPIQLR